jgi:outer membrane protein assembly factor BamB
MNGGRANGGRARAAGGVAAALLAALGCATQGQRGAGDAAEVGAALARLRPSGEVPVNASGHPMAYLVYRGPAGPTIGAFDLTRAALAWQQPGEATGRIEVGRTVVVHEASGTGGGAILVGRAGDSGAVLWRQEIPGDQRLIGYCVDGDSAYFVVRAFSDTGSHGIGALAALDARTGAARWRHQLPPGEVGGPAARGGVVAVPVATQYVILHDADSGAELARILSTEEAAGFVRAAPEGIFFGSKGVFRASVETAKASRRSAGYAAAALPRFARGIYGRDLYRPEQEDYSAIDRNRVQWRAATDARRMAFRDGLVFVHDFRFLFAIDAASGALRWAHAEKTADAVVAHHAGPTLLLATADGEIVALDAPSGQPRYRARVPGASLVHGATFDADGFAGAARALVDAAAPAPLATTLAGIVWDSDRRFSDELSAYVVEELGKLPGRAVTADLLKAVQAPVLPALARRRAEQALATRRDEESNDLLIEALRQRADFADDTRPTSVSAIARATVGTRSRPVAAALAEHLRRPETAPETILEISQAVTAAGAVEALPMLRDFLCMYRGEPFYDADPTALNAIASTLLALGGAADRQLLLFIAEEPRTVEPLQRHLRRALAAAPARAAMAAP